MIVGGDDERSDVKRCAWLFGNPVSVNVYNSLYRLNKIILRNSGYAQTVVGIVGSFSVHVGAEEVYLAVCALICL